MILGFYIVGLFITITTLAILGARRYHVAGRQGESAPYKRPAPPAMPPSALNVRNHLFAIKVSRQGIRKRLNYLNGLTSWTEEEEREYYDKIAVLTIFKSLEALPLNCRGIVAYVLTRE